MKQLTRTLLFISIGLFIISCSSSDKLLQRGNYKSAIKKSMKQIEKKKQPSKEKRILNRAFVKYVSEKKQKIKSYKSKDKNEEQNLIYEKKQWDDVDDIISEIEFYLDDNSVIIQREIQDKAIAVNLALFDIYITEAEEYKREYEAYGSKLIARRSYENYLKAEGLVPDEEFPQEDMDNMLQHAIERVNIVVDAFERDVERAFDYNLDKEKGYEIYYIDEQRDDIDCEVQVDCMFFDTDDRTDERSESFRERVQDGYTTTQDTAGNTIETPKYIDVEAIVYRKVFTREANWKIDFDVRDISGSCTLKSDTYRPRINYEVTRFSFSGDERALPSNYSERENQNRLPDEDQIKEDMAELIVEYFENNF